ncbi:MAG: hypothetical protein E7031_00605 [Akkermansiaceae bacterium]|nr:hypothetical protein [Akkermansiaceae bacterium]
MNKLLLVLPPAICACAVAETAPQLHLLQASYKADTLTLKLAARPDKALHARCMQALENPPEDNVEESPYRYEVEKIKAEEEGGYYLVGRSCVTGVKSDLHITDASGNVFTPQATVICEENGILLITLEFDLSAATVLPAIDTLTINGKLEYAAHYNLESELTEPTDFALPCKLSIGGYLVTMSVDDVSTDDETDDEEDIEGEAPEGDVWADVSEEELTEEDESYGEEYDDEEIQEAEESEDATEEATYSGYIHIESPDREKLPLSLITNIIIYDEIDEDVVISDRTDEKLEIRGTLGNDDMDRYCWDFACKEGILPQQGKISLRIRRKAHTRRYQFNQKLPVLQLK